MHTLAADPNTVVLAGDLLEWATLKTNEIGNLIRLVVGVMVLAAVAMAYWRTKSWVATLVAFLLGALVLWGIANLPSLQSKVGSEIDDEGGANAAPLVPGPDAENSKVLL